MITVTMEFKSSLIYIIILFRFIKDEMFKWIDSKISLSVCLPFTR